MIGAQRNQYLPGLETFRVYESIISLPLNILAVVFNISYDFPTATEICGSDDDVFAEKVSRYCGGRRGLRLALAPPWTFRLRPTRPSKDGYASQQVAQREVRSRKTQEHHLLTMAITRRRLP